MVLNLLCASFCVSTSYIFDILSSIFFCSLSSFLFCFSSFLSLLFSASRLFLFRMFLFHFLSFFPGGPCFPLLYFFNSSILSLLSCILFVMVSILFSSFLIFFEWWCAFVFYDVEYAELVIYAYFFYYSGICWITISYQYFFG